MAMWLLKTEPSDYSWGELARAGRARWDGVRNPAAIRNLAAMKAGDRVLVYHTGDEKAVVGVAEVVREAYPDPKYPEGKLMVVDIEARAPLARAVTLAEIKALAEFKHSPLVRQGRLSVVPIDAAQWKAVEVLCRG
jgi:predicted RNA-binding protein with PUA-like domain